MPKEKSVYYYWSKLNEHLNNVEMKPHQEIGHRIKNVREEIKKIDKLLRQTVKFKNENNISADAYWKRTRRHIFALESALNSLKKRLKDMKY